jgi:hypothetical protein
MFRSLYEHMKVREGHLPITWEECGRVGLVSGYIEGCVHSWSSNLVYFLRSVILTRYNYREIIFSHKKKKTAPIESV